MKVITKKKIVEITTACPEVGDAFIIKKSFKAFTEIDYGVWVLVSIENLAQTWYVLFNPYTKKHINLPDVDFINGSGFCEGIEYFGHFEAFRDYR